MRALSIRQPWAWAIAHGHKPVENRTRAITAACAGPLAIHATKPATTEEKRDALRFIAERGVEMLPLKHSTQTGGIVAVANVIGCVKSLEGGFEILWKVEGRHAEVCDAATSMWFVGPFGYVLADVKPVPFFPCKGSLGFFNVDMEVQP